MAETNNVNAEGLCTEIENFAESLPYWAKVLCSKLLSGFNLSDGDIESAYSYLLEDNNLKKQTKKPTIAISYSSGVNESYKAELTLESLQNLTGVNALVENQKLNFNPKLTIVYGINGSGKTGYVRLMKKAFHSRTTEDILPNIHKSSTDNKITAEFTFNDNSESFPLVYPKDAHQHILKQFSIFDNKCVNVHLDKKNQFVFRPSGLDFFADLNEAYRKVEEKIVVDIETRGAAKDYTALFDGDSKIKDCLADLSDKSKIEDLKKYIPISEKEKSERSELEEKKSQLQVLKKDKEIKELNNYKGLLNKLKVSICSNNDLLSQKKINEINNAIEDSIDKDAKAKEHGLEQFKTEKVHGVGSSEWKTFIEAADKFAKKQLKTDGFYPEKVDCCIFCQQSLSEEAITLIKSYWKFIKSQSEQDAQNARTVLSDLENVYGKLKFDLLPEDGVLTKWINEKYKAKAVIISNKMHEQKNLCESLIIDLENKNSNKHTSIQIDTTSIDEISQRIESSIKQLKDNDPSEEIKQIQVKINLLNHKEKLSDHIDAIETYIANLKWVVNASKAKRQISRRKITEKEKELSGKYFNQTYVDAFNDECLSLNCEIGIDINHTGASGTSYRQLFIKGESPTEILSEGEQKIISLADFLSEIKLSEITRGVVFDDPVTSLDDERKSRIAERIIEEVSRNQVIVFTHDLVFVSILIAACKGNKVEFDCHWIEKREDIPGYVFLNNSPSYEKEYRNSEIPRKHYVDAKHEKCPPSEKEYLLKAGFTALRTCYEVLVINDLFKNVVQRFNERVSVDSLKDVNFSEELIDDLLDSYAQCCRYMEGHSHSDKYAYQKPTVDTLNIEINRFDEMRTKIRKFKKSSAK